MAKQKPLEAMDRPEEVAAMIEAVRDFGCFSILHTPEGDVQFIVSTPGPTINGERTWIEVGTGKSASKALGEARKGRGDRAALGHLEEHPQLGS